MQLLRVRRSPDRCCIRVVALLHRLDMVPFRVDALGAAAASARELGDPARAIGYASAARPRSEPADEAMRLGAAAVSDAWRVSQASLVRTCAKMASCNRA